MLARFNIFKRLLVRHVKFGLCSSKTLLFIIVNGVLHTPSPPHHTQNVPIAGQYSDIVVGQVISLTRVSRRDSGAYLCIASNGVPPAVSRRIILEVTCKLQQWYCQYHGKYFYADAPSVTLDEEMVTVIAGHSVRLGCSVESYPDPVISWSYSNRAITKGKSYHGHTVTGQEYQSPQLVISRPFQSRSWL